MVVTRNLDCATDSACGSSRGSGIWLARSARRTADLYGDLTLNGNHRLTCSASAVVLLSVDVAD